MFVETDMQWFVSTDNGTVTNNDIVAAGSFSIGSDYGKFAEIIMGDTYLWERNLSKPQNVSSFTVPLYTFQSIYVDYGSSNSAAGWSFREDMYFLSVGFAKWDGYGVYEDPEIISNVGGKNTSTTPKADTNPPTIEVAGLKKNPNYDESPTINATITDESDVKTVTLHYKYNGNEYTVDMVKIENITYTAKIPALPYGTEVTYWIVAEDVYGNIAQSELYTYTVADYNPPEVSKVTYKANYDKDRAAVIVQISVIVNEPEYASGIQNVYIDYTIGGETHSEQLVEVSEGNYTITIIVPENLQTFTYTITATDNAGNTISQEHTIDISQYIPPSSGGATGGGGALGTQNLAVIIIIAAASILTLTYYIRKASK